MATIPSASTLESSSEAFKHPLPIVKQLHRQLEQGLEEKNARLRTLVGGSYRQLLGTAETIVGMRHDMIDIEHNLERVVDGCGRTIITRKTNGLRALSSRSDYDIDGLDKKEVYTWLARYKFLDACILAISRLLQSQRSRDVSLKNDYGKHLLVAAKLLVISRLLLKDVDITKNHVSPSQWTEAKNKVTRLRRRLLRAVECSFEQPKENDSALIDLMCVYSLITSSSAKDVARYFLHVRGQAIARVFDDEHDMSPKSADSSSVTDALLLYTRTLLDFQALIPRRLSESLKRLKAGPLLQDLDVVKQEGLRLDTASMWLSQGLNHFIPYIQYNDIDDAKASEMLKSWSAEASQILLQGFNKVISLISNFNELVTLRNAIFDLWIREGGRAKGYNSADFLDQLREAMNECLATLMETRSARLHLVATEIDAILATWQSTTKNKRNELWNHHIHDMESNLSGAQLRSAVVDQFNGRNDAITRVVHSYDAWHRFVDEMSNTLAELRDRKWAEDMEDLEDDSSLEDRQALLSIDDPAMLKKRLDRSLKQNFYLLHDKLSNLSDTYLKSQDNGAISAFILRVIREIRNRLPIGADVRSFGLSLVPEVHRVLVASISSEPLTSFNRSLKRRRKPVTMALWEGTPPLPVQPSARLFHLMHDINLAMSYMGSDLWTTDAVQALKYHLLYDMNRILVEDGKTKTPIRQPSLSTDVTDSDQQREDVDSVGATKKMVTSPVQEDHHHQLSAISSAFAVELVLDLLVLQQCLLPHSTATKSSELAEHMEAYRLTAGLDDDNMRRLQSTAQEFWKRTSLLFGPLAGS